MENKQTAVDWLFKDQNLDDFDTLMLYKIAKQMEKEQHNETWQESRLEYKGDNYIGKQLTFEEYYNKTYGKN